MKVYFTASTAEFVQYKQNYHAIRDFLVAEQHVLTRDWIGRAEERIAKGQDVITDIKQIYKECIQALEDADAVIIEDSVSNFSTGHQITVALQRQKPTLVLWSTPKHRHFKNTFIQGIDSEYLEVAEYNLENYQEIVRKFLKKYEQARQRNRFHLVLSDNERKYLDWAQYNGGQSRTKIIRKALREQIDRDEDYQKYLES
jgi:antirestriction protein